MFIYFLQRKGFIDHGETFYLQEKMDECRKEFGRDQYYEKFLKALFFEGFAKPEEDRSPEAKKLLGSVAANEAIILRPTLLTTSSSATTPITATAATSAAETDGVSVAPAALFSVPEAPSAAPSAPFLSPGSTAVTASTSRSSSSAAPPDLLAAVRAGRTLRKASLVPQKPKPASASGGLSNLLSAALANRRGNLNEEAEEATEGRKRADSWDTFD